MRTDIAVVSDQVERGTDFMSASPGPAVTDPLWTAIRAEAWSEQERDPYLRNFLTTTILKSRCLEDSLGLILVSKLKTECLIPELLHSLTGQALHAPQSAVRRDLQAAADSASESAGYLGIFLFSQGFLALQSYRISHWLWSRGRTLLAQHLQSRAADIFGADLHPAAQLGAGICLQAAPGVVIGEAVIGDDVILGAGAKVLGSITIGAGACVGAGCIVQESVPENALVASSPNSMTTLGSALD